MRRVIVVVAALALLTLVPIAGAKVLRVGTYHGIRGQYRTIQAAVNHAKPGDFILIAPGDYKTHRSHAPKGFSNRQAAVLITKPNITLRGMNRNQVVIDGTRKGPRCNARKKDQNFGPKAKGGRTGLNGVMIWKADNVKVENLTACNFLSGSGDAGNGVWWNGGDQSGMIHGWGYYGAYLTATSRYYDPHNTATAAAYGIFSSNWDGGTWYEDYASNFNDSGFYIGACQQSCNQTMSHAWAEYNALGYSGSNSGGVLVVKDSQFDHNEDGFDTNSQNGDNPPPQNGACPLPSQISPITHTHSCWVFEHNNVHDNNNPNIPSAGLAAAGPVGTGMSLSGARNDTVMNNTFDHNKAWGTIIVPFPDSGPPCTGGTGTPPTYAPCIYDEFGDALLSNTYYDNGGYGNPTNGDFGWGHLETDATSCFSGNVDTKGPLTETPSDAQSNPLYASCNGTDVPPDPTATEFLAEVACDSTLAIGGTTKGACPPGSSYPRRTHVVMHRLPRLRSMPHPCRGVPRNPWCPAHKKK
jgi:hypothetical protein